MLVGIELAEALNAKQGGKKQRLKTALKRSCVVLHQGKVIIRMRVLLGLDGLLEQVHDGAKDTLLVTPMGKQIHPHTQHMGGHLDDCSLWDNRPWAWGPTWAALATMPLPHRPPAVEMAETDCNRPILPSGLLTQHPTWALRVVAE